MERVQPTSGLPSYEMGQTMTRYPILLVGFNRPEKILERTKEILSWNPSDLYISIDAAKTSVERNSTREIRDQLKPFIVNPRVHLIFRSQNYGIKGHIPHAIDEILQKHSAIVVIEDDVQCSEIFYGEICKALNLHGNDYLTVGGFSSLPFRFFATRNRWRETRYFSAWGWGITRESWLKYERTIDVQNLHINLEGSKIWKKLSNSQKKTWIGRFSKVSTGEKITWDFQMQYSSFVHNYYHLNSLFRICENQGFSDERGTNTKSKRPLPLGRYYLNNSPFDKILLRRIPQIALEFLDSFVIAGDRVLLHKLSKIRRVF